MVKLPIIFARGINKVFEITISNKEVLGLPPDSVFALLKNEAAKFVEPMVWQGKLSFINDGIPWEDLIMKPHFEGNWVKKNNN